MRLENDIAIRRAVADIFPDDVALGIGDGWHRIVGRALSEIRETAGDAGVHIEVTHVENRRGNLVIAPMPSRDAFPRQSPTPSQKFGYTHQTEPG
ncbi:hypothetical protein [Sinorhizobium sp. BJ1]|uniref:hypothetical protein n=1 Tax=Sinorhizobium sp. BJ1 TaxID=2035455 RepID=UPI000BEA671D|nr:hypothetical protein [Sinorhizobium sp. BJ1]PDT81865.1 hypothetical protein CO676_20095 [Sinorhizobium sp. BJ1]